MLPGARRPLRRWLLPMGTTPDAAILLSARGVRAFGDGFVSVLLPLYRTTFDFSGLQVGAITTVTLAGSAALTLLVGLVAYRLPRRLLLRRASLLMVATGIGFAVVHAFWPLPVVASVGTLNSSAGDVSLFLPTDACSGGCGHRKRWRGRRRASGGRAMSKPSERA